MKRFLLLLVLGAAVAFAVWFGTHGKILTSSSSATITALLPKETLALVHLPDFHKTRDQWHQSDLYKLWREPAVQDFLQKPLANAPKTDAVRANIQDLDTLGVRDAFLALTAWQNDQPEIAAGFRFKGSADDAEKVIGKWRARAEQNAPGATRTTAAHQGHQLQLTTRDAVTVATAYAGDWFLAANNVETLKTLLDRVDGRLKDPATTLGADEHYTAAFKHMPMGYAALVYGRLDRYFEKLAARVPDTARNAQLDAVRQIRGLAAATSFDNGKIRDVFFVEMPKQADDGELTRTSLALATKDSFLYLASLLNLPKEMTLPDPAIAAATGWTGILQQKLGALGAAGVTLEDFRSAFGVEAGVIGDWPENTRMPALLATLPVRDATKANQILAAVTATGGAAGGAWTQSSKDGVQYYILPPANPMIPLAPTIGVGSDLLVVGADSASVEAAMRRGTSGGPSSLAAAQGFKASETLVPKPTRSFTYVDTAMLYARVDAAVRPMLVMAAAFVPAIANAVDLGKLPAPEVITKHLSPIVMSQNYQNDGYVTESIGPVSIYQAAIGIAGVTGAAATFYQKRMNSGAGGSGSALPSPSAAASPLATPEKEPEPEEP